MRFTLKLSFVDHLMGYTYVPQNDQIRNLVSIQYTVIFDSYIFLKGNLNYIPILYRTLKKSSK